MKLLEKDIEDIVYNSPWLLDERYVIPKIKGNSNEYGRQIKVGKHGQKRYIDLLFKDTRDNRPVILELKKGKLVRENIAQILEYRALVISMDDEHKIEWQNEFGQNYYCPKLILIGTTVSEEVRISANLAGVDIREIVGMESLEINFNDINDINNKLNDWKKFLNTGNRALEDRDEWIEEIYDWSKEVVDEYGNEDVTTIKRLCRTSSKDAWIEGSVFPFINIPFNYKDYYLGGFYEYYDESTRFSDEYFYFDFLVQRINLSEDEDEEVLIEMENKVREQFEIKEYDIIGCEEGIVTVKILRSILNSNIDFKDTLIQLLDDAVDINDEMIEIYGDFEE